MNKDAAEVIALKAIEWLAGNDELLPVFMGATGFGVDEFHAALGKSEFQVSVLDFIMMNDEWVLEFSEAQNIPPENLMTARHSLPGGEAINWT